MPTSFTAPIYNNEKITAVEFVNRMARMFTFTIHQREESLDEPLRSRRVSSHLAIKAWDDEDALAKIQSMTDEELLAKQDKEIALVKAANRTLAESYRSRRARYDNAIGLLNDWEPKTETGKMVQSKAIEHLRESREYDVRDDGPYQQPVPERLHVDQYRQQLIQKAERDLKYSKQRLQEEEQRAEQANRMLTEFVQDVALLPDVRLDT